ncbi:MAG: type II toxin-antitoxin system PemK/MazF family toxin [Deltaproteobacteria bacterium]|nr:type II toxin-antitoxin system PemK/MazF family toxin [Deltaproteobacteria bacterium]
MTERGDVLQLQRKIGFAEGESLRMVVVQSTPLNSILPTIVVVPLDAHSDGLARLPLVVPISARECGSTHDQLAFPSHVRVVATDRFSPGRVGRLEPSSLSTLDDRLRLVLGL